MAATAVVDHYESSDDDYDPEYQYQSSIDDRGECVESHANYTNDLAFYLNQLRKEETLCDITIIVNRRRFPAHKAVLCAASSYFAAMFTSGFQETSQSEITIEGSSDAFERLLDFAYTGDIRMNAEQIGDIISMASYMQFNKVAPLCSRFLKAAYDKKLIHLPDAFTILNMAMTHEFPSLQKHAEKYLAKHLVEFSETSSFLKDASPDYVESVLSRKDLVMWAKEEQILKAVVAWLKQDWEGRSQYAVPFLRLIRLGLVPIGNLKQLIDANMQVIPECKEMIEEVEKCLALKETSKAPLSYQFPHLFASRGTVTTVLAIQPNSQTVKCHIGPTRGWQKLGNFAKLPFEETVSDQQLIVVNGELYLAGGVHHIQSSFRSSIQHLYGRRFNHFFHYDRSLNVWTQLPSMLTRRSRFSMVHLAGYIYAIGGKEDRDDRFQQKVERYELETQEWEEVPSLPVALRTTSSVVYQNIILVYGISVTHTMGIGRQGSLFAFDPVRNTWISLTSEFVPINRELENGMWANPRLHPALVIEKGECYRILYYGSATPTVSHVTINLDDNPSATFSELHNPEDQFIMGLYNFQAGAFAINKRMFVNINGYIHSLAACPDEVEPNDEETSNGGKDDTAAEEEPKAYSKEESNVPVTTDEEKKTSTEAQLEKDKELVKGNEGESCIVGEEEPKACSKEESNVPLTKNEEKEPSTEAKLEKDKELVIGNEGESYIVADDYIPNLVSWESMNTKNETFSAVEFTFDMYSVMSDK
ncbi:kelch-like protein 26 isoform X2 [Amphiura filiformis]|uniref:kelch-like protein 26 isoform X2 n=1 Tax=Amphiura filiformis TaxID=82378 RepID=UPI003B21CAAD